MFTDSETRLYGVFGNPVSHSLSPVMQNAAFSHAGFNGVYLAFKIKDIKKGVEALKTFNMGGASITIPHKISVLPFLDELGPLAKKIGAVNTIINNKGILSGYNSDGIGAVKAIKEKTKIRQKKVAVIGAGGAARAIGFAMKNEGANVFIVNRTKKRGEKLAGDIDCLFVPLNEFNGGCDILVNATSVGMEPYVENMPVSPEILNFDMTVMDIVYTPRETKLLKEAKKRGCAIVEGISMFIYQGAFQFELWTGREAPLNIMKKTVVKALENKG